MAFSSFNTRKKRQRMSDINVTPMVDVMLVLLIIFMVTAPLLTSGITLDLPKGDGKMIQGSDKSLDISVSAKGQIFVANKSYRKAEVLPKVKAITANNPNMRIIISGDKKASYGEVVELMAMLRSAGFTKVGLKTDSKNAVKK